MTTVTVSGRVFATNSELNWGSKPTFTGLRSLHPVAHSQFRSEPKIDFFNSLPDIKKQIDSLRESKRLSRQATDVIPGGVCAGEPPHGEAEVAMGLCVHFA